MIRPLRDLIIAAPIEETRMVGLLIMPDNDSQKLRTHYRCKVTASGPLAQEHAPVGTVIHCSESWGEDVTVDGQKLRIGRLRDINGIIPWAKTVQTPPSPSFPCVAS